MLDYLPQNYINYLLINYLNMLGFVKSDKNHVYLGGEIFKAKQKKRRIILGIFAIAGFLLLNFVLYYLTNV